MRFLLQIPLRRIFIAQGDLLQSLEELGMQLDIVLAAKMRVGQEQLAIKVYPSDLEGLLHYLRGCHINNVMRSDMIELP